MNRCAGVFPFLAALLVFVPGSASAQEGIAGNLRVILDANVSSLSTTTTDQSGAVFTTDATNLFPQLTVTSDTLLYPHLRMNAGGVFDVNLSDFTTNAVQANSTVSRLRPYFELRSIDPVFAPGFGYYRRENRTSNGTSSLNLVGEDYVGFLTWRPQALPQSEFQFVRTNVYDSGRTLQDATNDFGSLNSRYAFKGVTLNYLGSYAASSDRRHQVDTRQWANAGRLDHGGSYFGKRLHWNTTYNVNRQDLSTRATGDNADVALPLIPFAGLAALSDTPVTTALSPNPLLIDGNRTASAGINLGFQPIGTASQAPNIGVDLATPSEVNRLFVWVDRDLPIEVSRSFTWELYISTDNVTWIRQTTIAAAAFGPFETRFQLDFPSVSARYIKIVTRSLSGTVTDASRYRDIFVTELEAFVRQPAGSAGSNALRTSQFLNTDVRFRLIRTPAVFYEGSFWYTGVLGAEKSTNTLSNGASIQQRFGPLFAVYGRAAREQGMEPLGSRVANVSNATLTMTPLRTFTASVLYSGIDESIAGLDDQRRSVLFQANTQLYRGIDLQFTGGWNFTTQESGASSRDGIVNASATVTPRQNMSFTVNYADTTTRPTGPFATAVGYRTQRVYVTLAVDPIRTLHLVLGEELLANTGDQTRRTHEIGVNWSPFPDGSLQFFVMYNDQLRDLIFGTEEIFRPGIRWSLTRQSYIDFTYQRIKSEFVSQRTESRLFGVSMRLFLR